jgi:hypothetical protein
VSNLLQRQIPIYGRLRTIACDGKCSKAWGHNGGRPTVLLSGDEDDDAYLADGEIQGNAPIDPGTSEGNHDKPRTPAERLGDGCIKWCARECERSAISEDDGSLRLPDFSRRVYNRYSRRDAADGAHARGEPDPNGPGVRVLRPAG